ncbi:MAG: cobaltochelatase subunit CobN, partial [Cyanobacteria bacterium P01_D01_bin.128]
LTRAELYGPLEKLEALVDEYYEAQSLDPSRLKPIGDRIVQLLAQTHLMEDFSLPRQADAWEFRQNSKLGQPSDSAALGRLLPQIDGYLCELKEAQIRDGLHILGRCPTGRQLRDLIIAIARHPSQGRIGLTRAIAQTYGLKFDPLTADLGQSYHFSGHFSGQPLGQLGTDGDNRASAAPAIAGHTLPLKPGVMDFGELPSALSGLENCRVIGDAVACLEAYAAALIDHLLADRFIAQDWNTLPPLRQELSDIQKVLLPALRQTPQELTTLLHGLEGGYVPSGPAGAPTRNRPDVLPTGRNFYSVDIRAIPTESAWDVGRKAAEVLIEDYIQQNGEYPKTLGLSVWGTATMRTGGDDLAEALALLGVQPVWDGPSRRVVDFEILPLSLLGRPRVDVTLRISGFFRDGFPNLIDLFDRAVDAVADLDEPDDDNPLAARSRQESDEWMAKGLDQSQANARSRLRIFGSKPGAYGAGLQGLIEAQNWNSDADLAQAYINWSSYAYGRSGNGRSAPEAFQQRLSQMQIVLHNQDNREHDLLDSDDYYQFQGGLAAAVRVAQGKNPQIYFGDNAVAEQPKVRSLQAEIARVYRSRVINPKWIAGVMNHGYKGAFEMAATVDYLFAYDATARCVADHMYQGVAEAYLFDPAVQAFIEQKNPWALRDMAERLIEANQRGLWKADPAVVEKLRAIAHQAEARIEES